MRMKLGDPVTILSAVHGFMRAYVDVNRGASFGWHVGQLAFGGMDYKHEGVRWIRGHHGPASREVTAMRVAQALVTA